VGDQNVHNDVPEGGRAGVGPIGSWHRRNGGKAEGPCASAGSGEGSNADKFSEVAVGDAISAVGVPDGVTISVEGATWEETVEALTSLPDTDEITLRIKRLQLRPKVDLTLQYPEGDEQTISVYSGENLRRAMLSRGVRLNDALARRFDSGGSGDCGGEGTCCTCAVQVREGMSLLSSPSTQEAVMLSKKDSWRLACKATVGVGEQSGSMTLRVNPREWD